MATLEPQLPPSATVVNGANRGIGPEIFEARVIAPPADGRLLSITGETGSLDQQNTALVNLGPRFSGWDVDVVSGQVEALNQDLFIEAIHGIVLRINDTDQSNDVWGGVDQGEAECLVGQVASFNDDPDYRCIYERGRHSPPRAP